MPGDVLYLTKPLGTGIMSAAAKIDQITEAEMRPVIDSMMELNAAGGAAMRAAGVHAATDVTGFGLAGTYMKCSNRAIAAPLSISLRSPYSSKFGSFPATTAVLAARSLSWMTLRASSTKGILKKKSSIIA